MQNSSLSVYIRVAAACSVLLLASCGNNDTAEICENDGGGAGKDCKEDSVESCQEGCLIDDVCFGDGQTNPENVCEHCDTAESVTAWSDNNGAACDDGLFCTVDDVCSGGDCGGSARDCSDSVDCNGAETCDDDEDACLPGTTTCDDGELCDFSADECVTLCSGCVIGDVCFGDGQTNPENVCEHCDTAVSVTAWSDNNDALCDDGIFCNGSDTCGGGTCSQHGGDPCADDGVYCNGTESCDTQADECTHSGDPCAALDEICYESTGACYYCRFLVDGSLGDYTGHDGSTWELAFENVQEGLDAAYESTGGYGTCEVWVAGGTYLPTVDMNGAVVPETNRGLTFRLREGVGLYGGFEGGETDRSQRDPDPANRPTTILSGEIGSEGIADNVCHVVTGAGLAILDGFTIELGNADGGGDYNMGGGMFILGDSLKVIDCIFDGNTASTQGGAVYIEGGGPEFIGCTFSNNTAVSAGGAVFASAGPKFFNCVFEGNTAEQGGGLYITPVPDALVQWGRFTGNSATATFGYGGGIYASGGPLTTLGVAFSGNSTMGANGCGGAIALEYPGYLYLADSTFINNSSGQYGGALNLDSFADIVNCTFSGNSAASVGGGIRYEAALTGDKFYLINSVMWDNPGISIYKSVGANLLVVKHSAIDQNCPGTYCAGSDNINLNDLPDAGVFSFEDDAGHLPDGSVCINAGDNASLPLDVTDMDGDGDTEELLPLDIDGNPRIIGGTVDMGAFEHP